jgi:hypothetical protein
MKRIDLAEGDWCILRSGDKAKVVSVGKEELTVKPAALNGFNNVLWWESPVTLRPDGRQSDLPSQNDVVSFMRWKDGILSDKAVISPVRYVRE